jgi:uncharacterized membrane protein
MPINEWTIGIGVLVIVVGFFWVRNALKGKNGTTPNKQ